MDQATTCDPIDIIRVDFAESQTLRNGTKRTYLKAYTGLPTYTVTRAPRLELCGDMAAEKFVQAICWVIA